MTNTLNNYSWFSKLTPEQFSKAYRAHQAVVRQKRAYSKKRRKLNRKWRTWHIKSLTYDTALRCCHADVEATTNIWEAANNG